MPRRSKSNRSSVPTKPKEDKPLSKFVKSEMKRSKDDTSTKRKRCYSEHAKKRDTEKSKAYLLLMDDKYFGVSLPYGECTEDFKKMVKKY